MLHDAKLQISSQIKNKIWCFCVLFSLLGIQYRAEDFVPDQLRQSSKPDTLFSR